MCRYPTGPFAGRWRMFYRYRFLHLPALVDVRPSPLPDGSYYPTTFLYLPVKHGLLIGHLILTPRKNSRFKIQNLKFKIPQFIHWASLVLCHIESTTPILSVVKLNLVPWNNGSLWRPGRRKADNITPKIIDHFTASTRKKCAGSDTDPTTDPEWHSMEKENRTEQNRVNLGNLSKSLEQNLLDRTFWTIVQISNPNQ